MRNYQPTNPAPNNEEQTTKIELPVLPALPLEGQRQEAEGSEREGEREDEQTGGNDVHKNSLDIEDSLD